MNWKRAPAVFEKCENQCIFDQTETQNNLESILEDNWQFGQEVEKNDRNSFGFYLLKIMKIIAI